MEKKQMKEFMTVRLRSLFSTAIDFAFFIFIFFFGFGYLYPAQPTCPLDQRKKTTADSAPQMYSKLVQRCFDDCVNDFTTKSLVAREEGCVLRCVDKFLKSSARLGERFQEQNAAMMQSGQLPGR